jgi:hypothetical protein
MVEDVGCTKINFISNRTLIEYAVARKAQLRAVNAFKLRILRSQRGLTTDASDGIDI